jgi:hypothetical protein
LVFCWSKVAFDLVENRFLICLELCRPDKALRSTRIASKAGGLAFQLPEIKFTVVMFLNMKVSIPQQVAREFWQSQRLASPPYPLAWAGILMNACIAGTA